MPFEMAQIRIIYNNLSKFFGNSKNIRTFTPLEPAKPLRSTLVACPSKNDAQMCGSFCNSSVMTDEFLFICYISVSLIMFKKEMQNL